MAYTSERVERNKPGYTLQEFTITLDGEVAIANLSFVAPKNVKPTQVNVYQKTIAADSSAIHVIVAVDEDNAEMDLTFDGAGDTDGAVFVISLEFPTGPDQDGSSTFGSGNTGKTFS